MDESTVVQAFAKRLVAARDAKGLTQAQLGEELGVSQQTVAEWEAGRGFPRRARRERLAEILGIEVGLPPKYAALALMNAAGDGREEVAQRRIQIRRMPRISGEDLIPERRPRSPASAMEAAFREALPEDLRQYCEASLPFGPNRFIADYMSDKVVAELKISPMMLTERLYASLWQLATLAKLAKDRRVVLIVAALNQAVRMPQRIQAEAWLHGIEIYVADSPERAAQIIVALEEGRDPTEPGDDLPDTPSE